MGRILFIVFLVLAIPITSFIVRDEDEAQIDDTDTQAIFQAKYISFFSLNCDWPEERKKGEFVISVFNNKSLYDELVLKYSSNPVGSQHLKIRHAKELTELTGSHIVFLGRKSSSKLKHIVSMFKGRSTLLVSQCEGCLDSGSHINFVVKDNKLLYELNQQGAADQGMLLGNKLVQFAVNR